ncbi:MAG: endonuclease III domain-containing protein [Methanobacteriaceae archaeon]|nr:endonuclease III domain-containing protein [Methanobacteriaceae archaeon]
MSNKIKAIYDRLYSLYGPQGWCPLINHEGSNPTKTGAINGYHPGDYNLPIERNDIYEVIIGTILTQNTSWLSTEKALYNLNQLNVINPEKLLGLDDDVLKSTIRPVGFMNQKAKYIRDVTEFFISLAGKAPTRKEIISVNGVGNETADSILLYAYKKPEFVIDTYTKRVMLRMGLVDEKIRYMGMKKLFESSLPEDVAIYQEYHALIVEHAKRYYSKKPYAVNDPLLELFK